MPEYEIQFPKRYRKRMTLQQFAHRIERFIERVRPDTSRSEAARLLLALRKDALERFKVGHVYAKRQDEINAATYMTLLEK